MQKIWKNMLQYYHDWSSNMETHGKQYKVTTFLPPPPAMCFHQITAASKSKTPWEPISLRSIIKLLLNPLDHCLKNQNWVKLPARFTNVHVIVSMQCSKDQTPLMCVGAVVLINSNNYMNVCKLYCKIFEIVVHDGKKFRYPHLNLCKTTCQFFQVWKLARIAKVGGVQISWNHSRKFVRLHWIHW